MLEQGLAQFAEPDLAQSWGIGDHLTLGLKLAKSCDVADWQNPDYPLGPSDYWIRDAPHSQFDEAIAKAGAPQHGRTRVAHLDTGYSDHQTTPQFLNRDLQKNFVDSDRLDDATDIAWGALSNPGHGTGTLGILAGKAIGSGAPLGCAPNAEVVPVRVANSFVRFLQQRHCARFRLCPSAQPGPDDSRRYHHDEYGWPRVSSVGGCGQRSLRSGRLHS